MENNESQKINDAVEINIPELFGRFIKSLKRFGWLLLAFAVVFAVIGFGYSKITYSPSYSSTVRFTVAPLLSSGTVSGATSYGLNTNTSVAGQMSSTFPYIIGSGILNDMIRYDVGYDYSYTVDTAAPGANLFEVTVSSPNAEFSYNVVGSIIKNYPRVANYIVGDVRMQVLDGSEPKIASKPDNLNNYLKTTLLGALVGVVLGAAFCLAVAYFNHSFGDRADVEKECGIPHLCTVPMEQVKRTGSVKSILKIGLASGEFSEAFRELKQRLNGIITRNGYKVIGVTSSVAGEGKTTVAYNLAKTFSTTCPKVILVDMSLKGRDIQALVNRKQSVPNTGITDVVKGKAELPNVVNSVSGSFDVLFAGNEDVSFNAKLFETVFEDLRNNYDIIIVDMPTVETDADTVAIADLFDAVLLTLGWDKTPKAKVKAAVKALGFSKAELLGFAFNCADLTATGYLAGSYYSSYRYGRYARYKKYSKAKYSSYDTPTAKNSMTDSKDTSDSNE